MAIKQIPNVYCGLNLGYIYSLDYNYEPQDGVKISIYFVNENGEYNTEGILSPTVKVPIIIGAATFNMYAVSQELTETAENKILKVNFIDETFQLNNYYIALKGRGCGTNVFTLGRPVDTRTARQKIKDSSDPKVRAVKNLTQIDDLEYSFNDFVGVLRKVFPVQLSASVPIPSITVGVRQEITRNYTGTFREVLDSWCSYLNLVYFFENNILKIYDLTKLQITLPERPSDALDYKRTKTIENTYVKTAFLHLFQEGGELLVNPKNFN